MISKNQPEFTEHSQEERRTEIAHFPVFPQTDDIDSNTLEAEVQVKYTNTIKKQWLF